MLFFNFIYNLCEIDLISDIYKDVIIYTDSITTADKSYSICKFCLAGLHFYNYFMMNSKCYKIFNYYIYIYNDQCLGYDDHIVVKKDVDSDLFSIIKIPNETKPNNDIIIDDINIIDFIKYKISAINVTDSIRNEMELVTKQNKKIIYKDINQFVKLVEEYSPSSRFRWCKMEQDHHKKFNRKIYVDGFKQNEQSNKDGETNKIIIFICMQILIFIFLISYIIINRTKQQ